MSAACPRLVIAGTGSGVGKTSLTWGCARACAARPARCSTFKVGPGLPRPDLSGDGLRPDLLQPRRLDDGDGVRRRALRAREPPTPTSRRRRRDGPVRRGVADGARRQHGRDRAAAGGAGPAGRRRPRDVAQLGGHGPGLRRVRSRGSTSPAWSPTTAARRGTRRGWPSRCAAAGLPPLLGAIPRGAFATLPSRHLGLVTADRGLLGDDLLDALADALERHVDVDALIALARAAAPLPRRRTARRAGSRPASGSGSASPATRRSTSTTRTPSRPSSRRASSWCASPRCASRRCRTDCTASTSAAATPRRSRRSCPPTRRCAARSREFAASGRPVYAECGGLMYLSQWIAAAGRRAPRDVRRAALRDPDARAAQGARVRRGAS